MLKVKVTPELLVRTFTDGELFKGAFLINGGVPKGSALVWVRPDVESRNEQEGSRWVEFFFATPDELKQARCVLLGRALGDMDVEEIMPTVMHVPERHVALCTKLAALLEMHTEPHPGSDRDAEVVAALAQYAEVFRG
jgi:hypothetical protein